MKKILNEFQKMDKTILNVIKSGVHFSFIFCLLATFILITYESIQTPKLFDIGISLFRSSLFFLVAFITYGFVFNKIKQNFNT